MRLGVSGKVLLALTVLLVAFAGDATFTVLTIHQARQGVLANEAYLDLQGSVDAAWKSLNDFAPSLGRNMRMDPNLALAFKSSRKHLDDAVAAIDRFLEKEPASTRRTDFEATRKQISTLRAQVDAIAAEAGAAEGSASPKARPEFESHFAMLTHSLNRLRRPLRGESGQIAQRLTDDEDTALQMALGLGITGLAIAAAAFLFTLRTLRPLSVLRARAREVAGGDYARRTGVTSHDEIGDLAREFDAMAGAIEEREHKLIRSERLATVGRMAAQITHEVRNPLASIGLYAELLGDEINPGNDEGKRLVTSIISEVDRLTEITETYLRFARLPKPKLWARSSRACWNSRAPSSRRRASRSTSTWRPGCPRSRPTRRSSGRRCSTSCATRRRPCARAGASASASRPRMAPRRAAPRPPCASRSRTPAPASRARTSRRSSTRSSRRRSAARGSGSRSCSRSSSSTAGASTWRAGPTKGRRSR